ncbi:MAG: saccharopine dehydrogenase NADP-binding domain-containing protein [Taibaiella sp.]|nr:saccharopine dehydrogenase NADP-binding domain-containing protein [Taibaiella sp.]
MKTVLIVGAGKSSTYLIDYMLRQAKNNWKVIVSDSSAEAVAEKIAGHPKGEAAIINIQDDKARKELVKKSDIVISLMPPHLHILLAKDCLEYEKNLITSSYASNELKAMNSEVMSKSLLFMCEMGLDPGIDHMSANKIIHSIQKISGDIVSFKSYCGGACQAAAVTFKRNDISRYLLDTMNDLVGTHMIDSRIQSHFTHEKQTFTHYLTVHSF